MNRLEAGRLEPGDTPRLTGSVNLETVSGLLEAADSLFENGVNDCTIDLGRLEDSDSATVALLLEWKRRAARNGCLLRFASIPSRLMDIARISRLDGLLES